METSLGENSPQSSTDLKNAQKCPTSQPMTFHSLPDYDRQEIDNFAQKFNKVTHLI